MALCSTTSKRKKKLTTLVFMDLINVAKKLAWLSEDLYDMCDLVRDYRNNIHVTHELKMGGVGRRKALRSFRAVANSLQAFCNKI